MPLKLKKYWLLFGLGFIALIAYLSLMPDPPDPGVHLDIRAIEYRARLFRFVGQLPETQRRVVHERFVDQRSIRETAQRLGKSEGAIKQLQLRALERLRAQMEGRHA